MKDPTEIYKYCPNCKNDLEFKEFDGDKFKKCNNCGFTFWNNSKPVTSIILHEKGKVLMLKRSDEPFKDFWVLPGGFIKTMETAEEAVKREAKEETGSSVEIEKFVGTYLIDMDPRGIHLDIVFAGKAINEIKLNNENSTWQYFSPNDLPDKIAYRHREAIKDWHKGNQNI